MAWVYILRCCDGLFYVGSTNCLEARIEQHMSGRGAHFTRHRLPVELVWAAEVDDVAEAYALEKRIQNWSRAKRQALIDGRYDLLPGLSRSAYRR